MNNLPEFEETRQALSEEYKLDSGRVFAERRIRERNALDKRIEKARKDRERMRSLFGNAE